MKFSIREAVASDIDALVPLHLKTWRAAYEGIFTEAQLNVPTHEIREAQWRRNFSSIGHGWFCFVVENESLEMVGFAVGRRKAWHEFEGELEKIYLLAEYQRQGIGQTLVSYVASRFMASGIANMWLFAHPRNSSCRFYEVLGAEKVEGNATGVIYAWRDIRHLCPPAP